MTSPAPPPVHHVVGSASIWVLGRVAGPLRTAPVLHSDRDVLFVDLEGFCLGVLGARAVQVPCGVRTQLPHLSTLEAGAPVSVEDGGIVFADTEVLVTNIVDTTVPVLSPDTASLCGEHLADVVGDQLAGVREQVDPDSLDLLAKGDSACVAGLLGRGPGMTPLGDDVLAGWLAAAVSSRHPGLAAIRSEVALSASERTSPLSATLLECAARGEGVPEFRSLLLGLANGNDEITAQSLELMLGIKDGTGVGMVLGAVIALRSLA